MLEMIKKFALHASKANRLGICPGTRRMHGLKFQLSCLKLVAVMDKE